MLLPGIGMMGSTVVVIGFAQSTRSLAASIVDYTN